MDYYLIKWNDKKSIIQANSGLEAVTSWFKDEVKNRALEGQLIKFNPREFSVENIGGTVLIADRIK